MIFEDILEQTSEATLDRIPANRRLVDELFAHKKITAEARDYALEFLTPADRWGIWVSRVFLAVGSALVLCGVVYFFAFNWAKITPPVKLASIQAGLLGCLLGAYYYKLERVAGQVLLLAASVLTGVFMAVYGQIYQTGADAYQLFMMWSVFIFGWTIISKFAAQWLLWLAVTNVFLGLWWEQSFLPEEDMVALIFIVFALLNGAVLLLREIYLARGGAAWLDQRWLRLLLTGVVLLPLAAPVVIWILDSRSVTPALEISAVAGLAGHGLLYGLYRFKFPDMWPLAAIALSLCVILETLALDFLARSLEDAEILMFLLMGLATIGIFSLAVLYLRRIVTVMEAGRV